MRESQRSLHRPAPEVDSRPLAATAAMGIVIAAAVLAYANTLSTPFFFDDLQSVVQNPTIRQLHPLTSVLKAPQQSSVAGRPVVNLSLAVNYAVGALDVRGYHAFNLSIHLLCSLLLFGIVRRTLERAPLGDRFKGSASWLGVAIAALWALHPLLTESVTYVTQRTELLMASFYLLTLYSVIRGWSSRRRDPWFALAVIACGMGMASKEVMVSAPLVVLLYDRSFVSGSFRGSLQRHPGLYIGLAATWGILAALMVSMPRSASVGFGLGVSSLDYLRTQAEVLVWYLRLCFWPQPLVVSYEWELVHTFSDCLPAGLIITTLLLTTIWACRRRPALGFVGACFFLILAPTSSVVPIVTEIAAERRMYLPLALVVVLIVLGLRALLHGVGRLRARRSPVPQYAGGALLVALAAVLGLTTFRRNADYRSVLSIWADTVAKRPLNYRAHSNLAGALIDANRLEEAASHCQRALQLRPDHARARANLALARKRQGHLEEAIAHYNLALLLKPQDPGLHHNLAIALVACGDFERATEHFAQALRSDPGRVRAHFDMANALVQCGRSEEAAVHFRAALRLDPTLAPAHYNLGNLLFEEGQIVEATEHFSAAVRIAPGSADARSNLAVALAQQGRTTEAIVQYREALRIDPHHLQARRGLEILQAAAPEGEGG